PLFDRAPRNRRWRLVRQSRCCLRRHTRHDGRAHPQRGPARGKTSGIARRSARERGRARPRRRGAYGIGEGSSGLRRPRAAYAGLRAAEGRDAAAERSRDRAGNAAMFARENHGAQNHMISVTQRKPGIVRWFTARLVFWIIGEFATRYYRPGFLSDIGTIHFA